MIATRGSPGPPTESSGRSSGQTKVNPQWFTRSKRSNGQMFSPDYHGAESEVRNSWKDVIDLGHWCTNGGQTVVKIGQMERARRNRHYPASHNKQSTGQTINRSNNQLVKPGDSWSRRAGSRSASRRWGRPATTNPRPVDGQILVKFYKWSKWVDWSNRCTAPVLARKAPDGRLRPLPWNREKYHNGET
jgi:hypothetical protein